MGRQWLRACSLNVGGREIIPDANDPSAGVRVRFQIHASTIPTPNHALIRITNLSDATSKLPDKGAKVTLTAGYRDNTGLIFDGTVKQALRGKESSVETYLDLNCADGDRAFVHAVANKALASGATGKDVLDMAVAEFAKFDVTMGRLGKAAEAALSKLKYPRAQAFFGMARDPLRTLASTIGGTWSIQFGKVEMLTLRESLGGPVVLNSQNGLIGMPVETTSGIMVRCLINPSLRVNDLLQIDEAIIQRAAITPDIKGEINADLLSSSLKTSDGTYRILAIDYTGDTRGQEWYCDCTCIGITGTAPPSQVSLGRGADVNAGTR